MKSKTTASSVSFFFTRGTGMISGLIAQSSSPLSMMFDGKKLSNVPSHVGLVFDTPDGKLIFEAHIDSGWMGPKPWSILVERKKDNLKRRLWTINPELNENEAQDIWDMCHAQIHLWDYHRGQLGLLYLWRRLHIPFGQDSAKVVCSEAAGRVCFPYIDLRKIAGVKCFDRLTPSNEFSGLQEAGYILDEVIP